MTDETIPQRSDKEVEKQKERGKKPVPPGVGIAIGICIGVAFGLTLKNFALGIGMAVVFAGGFEVAFKRGRVNYNA
jgi:hypothetical protein